MPPAAPRRAHTQSINDGCVDMPARGVAKMDAQVESCQWRAGAIGAPDLSRAQRNTHEMALAAGLRARVMQWVNSETGPKTSE